MRNWPARIVLAVIAPAVVVFGYWLGGFEFARGDTAVQVLLVSVAFFFLGITCPIFDKDPK